ILAAEHGYVAEVERRRAHADDDIARARFRVGSLDQTQRVDGDRVGEFITAHGVSPSPGLSRPSPNAHFAASKIVREANDGSRTASIEILSKYMAPSAIFNPSSVTRSAAPTSKGRPSREPVMRQWKNTSWVQTA